MASTTVYENCTDCCPDGVETDCCPDDAVPTTLFATASGGTGSCNCFDGATATLTWDAGNSRWQGTGTAPPCSNATTFIVRLACVSSVWQLSYSCNGTDFSTGSATSETCTAGSFQVATTFVVSSVTLFCCSGLFTLTIVD